MARGKDNIEIEPQKFDGQWQRNLTNLSSGVETYQIATYILTILLPNWHLDHEG